MSDVIIFADASCTINDKYVSADGRLSDNFFFILLVKTAALPNTANIWKENQIKFGNNTYFLKFCHHVFIYEIKHTDIFQ